MDNNESSSFEVIYDDLTEEEREQLAEEEAALMMDKLTEQFVDPGYELDRIDPKGMQILENLREHFGPRGKEPIPYYDLKSIMYRYKYPKNRTISQFHILNLLRKLWRAGHIRRFVVGRSRKGKGPRAFHGRGNWYGIHYSLYPREEKEIYK